MGSLDIKQLEYFVHAAEAGSISKAAKAMDVSQQALSKGIKSLEEALGAELFARASSGVVLTEAGAALMKDAKATLQAFDKLGQHASDFKRERPTIHIGISPFCFDERGGTLSGERLTAFQRTHSEAEFVFQETPTSDVARNVIDGILDFGIAPVEDESGTLAVVNLAFYQMAVILSKKCALSACDTVPLSALSSGKVALSSVDAQNEEDYLAPFFKTIRSDFEQAPVQIGYADASKLIDDESTFVVRPMQHALRTTSTKQVAIRPLVDSTGAPIEAPLNLFWKADRSLSGIERELVDTVVTLYHTTH